MGRIGKSQHYDSSTETPAYELYLQKATVSDVTEFDYSWKMSVQRRRLLSLKINTS